MNAVEKAAKALRDLKGFTLIGEAEIRYVAAAVLDAVAPHESSDEGTCWCPVAEQAGRERDRYRGTLQVIASRPIAKDPYAIARAALNAEETP